MSQFIIAKEKDSTRYLDASTPEVWAKNALKLLTERWEEGYWYLDPEEAYDGYIDEQALTQEQIDALPTEQLRKSEQKKLNDNIRYLREKGFYQKWYNEVKEVVGKQDLSMIGIGKPGTRWHHYEPRAWVLLRDRDGGEYENVHLEELE
jgi:hypothetical protein